MYDDLDVASCEVVPKVAWFSGRKRRGGEKEDLNEGDTFHLSSHWGGYIVVWRHDYAELTTTPEVEGEDQKITMHLDLEYIPIFLAV